MPRRHVTTMAIALLSTSGGCGVPHSPKTQAPTNTERTSSPEPASEDALLPVARADLSTATGELVPISTTRSHVETPELRVTATGNGASHAELAFSRLARSAETVPLANGEVRTQLGLKLRAKDTCNVVYVMWRIAPMNGIFVSVKYNPNETTHAECGPRGYVNLSPRSSAPTKAAFGDESHVLRAETIGSELRVFADGSLVWEGTLPPIAFSFDGPSGVRSDNASFDFELRDDGGPRARPAASNPRVH